MNVFIDRLEELAFFEEAKENLIQGKHIQISGCVDAQKEQLIYALSQDFPYKVIVACSDSKARRIYEDYRFFDSQVCLFPAKDYLFFQADLGGKELTRERLKCHRKMIEGKPLTIITTMDSFLAPCLGLDVLRESCISIGKGSVVMTEAVAAKLVQMGYEKSYQVEMAGQFSIRGGILDVFDLTEENPYRIELWGDEVDTIRRFDVLSQRSIEMLDEVTIYPATETILTLAQKSRGLKRLDAEAKELSEKLKKQNFPAEAKRVREQAKVLKEELEEFGVMANLDSYLKFFYEDLTFFADLFKTEETLFVIDEPIRTEEHLEAAWIEYRESMSHRLEKGYVLPSQAALLYTEDEVWAQMDQKSILLTSMLDSKMKELRVDAQYRLDARNIASFQNDFALLVKQLKLYRKNGYQVILLSPSRTRAQRLAQNLRDYELSCFYQESPDYELKDKDIMVTYGQLSGGFEYSLLRYALICESDIFGKRKKKEKRKVKYQEGQKIRDFTELKVGDYVVHESYGLGIYRGIEKLTYEKVVRDYMKIEYRDGGELFVLATSFDCVMKYASADAEKVPKLNKLGTQEWTRTKTRVKSAVGVVAKDLVELYAARQQKKGFACEVDTVWQKEFEEMFPFEETDDQLKAIAETKADLESDKIMDRLICGDVGFGKTEVAIRAAFKVVQEGRQVVVLVPTTILAKQHYDNFVQRMKDFPVSIEMLSRFRTARQQKETLEKLKKGMVDIVIGTHRVLSKDVTFHDLGLLVVDEEQRFGVTHKERIKQMRDTVDVLTLTATPIPRTLHMSLVGIRDMSVLEEAPNDRMPIQTFVMEYNEELVREAIGREVARGGQVYYVYNRVNTIADVTAAIQRLVPDANVAFAHGQMKESELERIMFDFVNGEIDVLVSTTIVETGLDIPNVNTMIIHDSDQMGLSQLYQLRGRVGRSNRTAYAFLLYRREKLLREVAEKRLKAIREFTELGSGIKIAMKDLEIRGAGNLLGKDQHGHMQAVGYDLYCKMLSDAVKSLKGEQTAGDFETTVDLDVDAFIPDSYIMNEYQKLDIYKRIAAIESHDESEDMKNELVDRFGQFPKSVENLLRIALVRMDAHALYVTQILGKKDGLTITVATDAKLKAENIPIVLANFQGKLQFAATKNPTFTYKLRPSGNSFQDEAQLLDLTEQVIREMRVRLL